MKNLKTDQHGFKYFETLPEKTRLATEHDFKIADKLAKGVPCLLLGETGRFWPKRIYSFADLYKIVEFIDAKRCWVFVVSISFLLLI